MEFGVDRSDSRQRNRQRSNNRSAPFATDGERVVYQPQTARRANGRRAQPPRSHSRPEFRRPPSPFSAALAPQPLKNGPIPTSGGVVSLEDVAELRGRLYAMEQKLALVGKTTEGTRNEKSELQSRVDKLADKVRAQDRRIENQEAQISVLSRQKSQLEQELRVNSDALGDGVANSKNYLEKVDQSVFGVEKRLTHISAMVSENREMITQLRDVPPPPEITSVVEQRFRLMNHRSKEVAKDFTEELHMRKLEHDRLSAKYTKTTEEVVSLLGEAQTQRTALGLQIGDLQTDARNTIAGIQDLIKVSLEETRTKAAQNNNLHITSQRTLQEDLDRLRDQFMKKTDEMYADTEKLIGNVRRDVENNQMILGKLKRKLADKQMEKAYDKVAPQTRSRRNEDDFSFSRSFDDLRED